MIANEVENVDPDGKPVLAKGKDFVVFTKDNISEVEKFIGQKLGHVSGDMYGFPNDGKSRRTFYGDYLMWVGDRVDIYPPKVFKNYYEIAKA